MYIYPAVHLNSLFLQLCTRYMLDDEEGDTLKKS